MAEIHEENILDKLKAKLGSIKGSIVASVSAMLGILKKSPNSILTTIEIFEIQDFGEYKARVDTGALVCALHATGIIADGKRVKFKHGGKDFDLPLLRMKDVKSANGITIRPRVEMTYKWNGKAYSGIETSLADRSMLKFKLLVGRNLISVLKLPVHISDKETFE